LLAEGQRVVSGLVVSGISVPPPDEVAVRSWRDGEVRFAPKGRRRVATELVIHETVTRDAATTVAVLQRRGLSVHLVLGPDGAVTQHGDLATDVLWHAGAVHNLSSFGIEVVNPYYPRLLRKSLPWDTVIRAPWAHEGQYVLPTPAQAEATAALIRWATSSPAPGMKVPRRWPGLRDGRFQLGPVAATAKATPGILAHHYFGHADGAWLVFYAWLRLEAGLSPAESFAEATRRATDARRVVEIRDLRLPAV
jgi:N-acetylmuramoyl-L-alanine amidase